MARTGTALALLGSLASLAGCSGGGGGGNPPQPPDAMPPPSDVLIAFDREGELYTIDPATGGGTLRLDTGSGNVTITGGANATFAITASQGSGDLIVGYADATLRKDGRKVVGAERGDARTTIVCETGSGDCEIRPNTL